MPDSPPSSALPEPLPPNPRREAIHALGGYDYQIWVSIQAWLRLEESEALYLEGAEDIDHASDEGATTVQVKRTEESLSLNTARARDAIKNFWATTERAAGTAVRYHYLTTSAVAHERNADFFGMPGIDAWHKAAFDVRLAEALRAYLLEHLDAPDSLLTLLRTAATQDLQAKLFSRLHWLPNQPAVEVVKEAVTERLAERLGADGASPQNASRVRERLFAHCWEQILRPKVEERILTAASLRARLTEATTIHLAVSLPTAQGLAFVAAQLPSLQRQFSAFSVFSELPGLPEPLLDRSTLAQEIATRLLRREAVLLTGSVYKGKTTIAQVAAGRSGLQTRWIDLTGRDPAAVADIFRLVAAAIEADSAKLFIFDDLNTSPSARRTYERPLQRLLHHAALANASVLLTAQGDSDAIEDAVSLQWGVQSVAVPGLTLEELTLFCTSTGCPSTYEADAWARTVLAQSGGHPKLAQVRILELSRAGWPAFSPQSAFAASPGYASVKQAARALLASIATSHEYEFALEAAEFSVPPSQAVLLKLAELPVRLPGAAAVIDRLRGQWLEVVSKNRYRVTPVLRGEVGITWTKEQHQAVHAKLHDAIAGVHELTPAEVAALLFHAFIAADVGRLTRAALAVLSADDEGVRRQLLGHLSWLLYLTSDRTEAFSWLKSCAPLVHAVQFRIAVAEKPSELTRIAKEWRASLGAPSQDDQDRWWFNRTLYNFAILTTLEAMPLELSLDAATSISQAPDSVAGGRLTEALSTIQPLAQSIGGFPKTATPFQVLLGMRAGVARAPQDLIALTEWVTAVDSNLLSQFEQTFEWPLVSTLGAYVHSGWAIDSDKENPDWTSWLSALDSVYAAAKARAVNALGWQVARAKSIITCEYLSNSPEAIELIDVAARDFGASAVLEEQRVNVLFQGKQFQAALDVWGQLVEKFGVAAVTDPFAFRRVALAATELGRHGMAVDLYVQGSATLEADTLLPTRSALLADAAHAALSAGEVRKASSLLVRAALELPPAAREESNPRWQAAVQAMTAIAMLAAEHAGLAAKDPKLVIAPGKASAPDLRAEATTLGQDLRVALFIAQVGSVELDWPDASPALLERMNSLMTHESDLVRFSVSKSLVSHQLRVGPGQEYGWLALELLKAVNNVTDRAPGRAGQGPIFGRDALAGLLVAALAVSARPHELLDSWKADTRTNSHSDFMYCIDSLGRGLQLSGAPAVEMVVKGSGSDEFAVYGAAIAAFQHQSPKALAFAQARVVASLIPAVWGMLRERTTNPLAVAFARRWKLQLPFHAQFNAPRLSVPALASAIRMSEGRRANLPDLLAAVEFASGVNLSSVIKVLRASR